MTPIIKILAISVVLVISSAIKPNLTLAQQGYVSFQVFYDQLSPYGQWVNYSNYGYVWIPDAGSDFVPYSSGGHWILTDYGWTWVSDYSWGWAPFHYGRWSFDNSYGWFWVPDNEWGPSWVTWRRGNGYYGWEPMEPGISISASFGRPYNSRNDHWMFVRDRDIDRSNINHYYVNRTENQRIIQNSTVINKTYVDNKRHATYVSGPAREDVQKVTGRKVNAVQIRDNTKPGQSMNNGQLQIYRPQVNKSNDKERKPVPSKITALKDAKRTTNQPQTAKPSENNRPQQNTVKPQHSSNTNAKPVQPQNVKTANNSRQEKPQNTVKPQSNNNTNTRPVQPQNVKPANNSRQEKPQNTVKPQSNNNTNTKPAQQQNVKPADNNRQERQQNTVKPQNNDNTNAKPTQQQNVKPPENRQERPPQNVRPPEQNRNEQPRENKPEQEKKRD